MLIKVVILIEVILMVVVGGGGGGEGFKNLLEEADVSSIDLQTHQENFGNSHLLYLKRKGK